MLVAPLPSTLSLKHTHTRPAPFFQLTELAVIEALEALADPAAEGGEWIATFDLEEAGPALTLSRQGSPGVCGVECRTLAMAAGDALDAMDTDLAERLFAATADGSPAPDLGAWLCGAEGSGACVGKAPPLPPGRLAGPAFQPEAPEAAQARRMMAQMRAAGMGGELFDRSSIEETLAAVDAEEAEEEEEEGLGGMGGVGAGAGAAAPPPRTEGLGGILDDLPEGLAPPVVGGGKGATKRAAQARAAAKKAAAAAAAAAGGGGGGGASPSSGGVGAALGAARGWAAAAAAKARALAAGRAGARAEL